MVINIRKNFFSTATHNNKNEGNSSSSLGCLFQPFIRSAQASHHQTSPLSAVFRQHPPQPASPWRLGPPLSGPGLSWIVLPYSWVREVAAIVSQSLSVSDQPRRVDHHPTSWWPDQLYCRQPEYVFPSHTWSTADQRPLFHTSNVIFPAVWRWIN